MSAIRLVPAFVLAASLAGAGVTPDEEFPIPTCEKVALSPPVDRLLKPVLLARATALRARIEWDKAYEAAFYRLVEKKGPVALEAKVALMAYYVGEHYGEELLEAVFDQSKEADSLVHRYRTCRPSTSFEHQLDGVVVLRNLYNLYPDEPALAK